MTSETKTRVEVKNVKTLNTPDGYAYNCSLYMDGEKVAEVHEEGHGGAPMIRFSSRTVEQTFYEYAKTLPPEPCDFGDGVDREPLPMDGEFLIGLLVEQYLEDKRLRRLCRKKTLVRMTTDPPGTMTVFSRPYSPEYAARLRAKYGVAIIEIVNETIT